MRATVLVAASLVGAAVATAAVLAPLEDGRDQKARPAVATPGDAPSAIVLFERLRAYNDIVIRFPTPYAIGDQTRHGSRVRPTTGPATAESYDNYHVLLDGPRGRGCRSRFRLGYLTERRRRAARTVHVRIDDGHSRRPWCAGRWRGRVEYRQPDRVPVIPPETLGVFAFEIRP